MDVFNDLKAVLTSVYPTEVELNKRPLPLPVDGSEFGTRYDTGVDCDEVFKNILVGNL